MDEEKEFNEMCQRMQDKDVEEALLNDMRNAKTTEEKVHIANLILDLREGKDISDQLGTGRKSPDNHAPDEIGGTDEPSEGQALGSEKAEEGES